ncbi:MAG: glycosyltransferase family 4 protein [Thaumarchaeota archaeon]|nr:glycosyltransferase family 4 protein [Nitrososphaerota archaeon]
MAMVYLVVTRGRGSLDLYSGRLAKYLRVRKVETTIYQEVSEQFGRSPLSPRNLRGAFMVYRFVKFLNSIRDIPHLPNHHLGRFAKFLDKPYIITAHDLIRYFDMLGLGPTLIKRPTLSDSFWLKMDYEGVKGAARIIAPSEYTKGDLVKYLGIPEWKISVIHHGVDEEFRPLVGKRPCKEPYILYVGSEQPRKNLGTLFRAFRLLKDRGFKELKLVKVGRSGGEEFRRETLRLIRALSLERDVILMGWVSKEELASYYTQAELFAFPSIYEGFGWPPLEAMACGCPVISSNSTSMPEVLGKAAVYVDPMNPEAWCDAMEEVLKSDRLRRRLSSYGMARAREFDWRRTARETEKVYREVEEEPIRVGVGRSLRDKIKP